MTTRIANGVALASLNAAVDELDAGPAAGKIEIRTGTQPAGGPDAAATGTLLGTLTLSDPAFGNAADQNPGGRATAAAITGDTSADATGTAGWFRALTSDNVAKIDGSISLVSGGGDMELDNTNIVAGQAINVSSWTIDLGES